MRNPTWKTVDQETIVEVTDLDLVKSARVTWGDLVEMLHHVGDELDDERVCDQIAEIVVCGVVLLGRDGITEFVMPPHGHHFLVKLVDK